VTIGLRAAFLIEHLDLAAATNDDAAVWEAHQLVFLSDEGMLSTSRKARQIGWSFCAAADAVAAATLEPRITSVFVSINMEETKEKIVYAKAIIEALDKSVRPAVTDDNATTVTLANGSRILSHPCKPIRGKGRARVYLDEFAHYARDRAIYASALPVTTRGGCIRIGSTPLGAGGMFHEVTAQNIQRYPGFRRYYLPWWTTRALCTDVLKAGVWAGGEATEERVRLFGTERLQIIYANMVLEDFQQEYECDWIDESTAFVTWDEVKRAQALAQTGDLDCTVVRSVGDAHAAIDELAGKVASRQVEISMVAGMDVGRRKDLTEFWVFGRDPQSALLCRLAVSLSTVSFDDQLAVVSHAMEVLSITRLCVDETGLGMMLAEKLKHKFWVRVMPVTFTNQSKELMAVEAKVRFQKGTIHLPADRDLANQVHSIRRLVTPSKNVTFDVARAEKHHADKFWAVALACLAGKAPSGQYFR